MTPENARYARVKQAPTAHTICTNYGDIDLTGLSEESQAKIKQAVAIELGKMEKNNVSN